jgi:hypothetical protein
MLVLAVLAALVQKVQSGEPRSLVLRCIWKPLVVVVEPLLRALQPLLAVLVALSRQSGITAVLVALILLAVLR